MNGRIKIKTTTITAAVLAVLLMAGCAAPGENKKFTMNDVDSLQPGITTIEEAKAILGRPTTSAFGEDGRTVLAFQYSNYAPIGFRMNMAMIIFGKDGKMIRVASKSER